LPDIAPNTNATVLIRGALSDTAAGSVENTATVTTPTPWLDGTNPPVVATAPPVSVTPKQTATVTATKTADQTTPRPGDTIVYTVTVLNSGPSTAQTPTITDAMPAAVTSPQYSLDGGTTWSAWSGSVKLPDVAANARATVQIRGVLSPSATGSVANTAVITSPTPRPDGGKTSVTVTTPPINVAPPIAQKANITISAKVDRDTPSQGDTVNITVTVKNDSPATAMTPTVAYEPPAGLSNLEYSLNGGSTWIRWTGQTKLNDIAGGASQEFVVRGKVDGSATGTITSTYKAASSNVDPATPGKSASVHISVATQKMCTVTYYNDNGVLECQKIVCGTPATRPPDPERYKSSFAGWFTAPMGLSYQWDFSQPIYTNITLYAKWVSHN
jgi:uncharacterized repeat protein (TIGR01451 family)